MKFYFQPKTQAYKKWGEIMVGDRVLLMLNKDAPNIPATVRKIHYAGPKTCVAIEFDEPVPFIETHNCLGDVPSGNGYFIFIRPLIEKIIE